ncbi:hypothetical protein B0H14DRAFT_2863525 [Mycena olivaceomarginata]|nr:hypothetical protein B0H14DRAFT_2863525 [Mycena olivaceomarginata]
MEGRRWNRRVGWQIRAARNGGAKLEPGRDKIGAGARKSLREERRTRLSSRVIGRERWCATDRKRKQTRVTLSGCGGQRNDTHRNGTTIGGSVSVGVESWNWGALWTIIQECNANLASSMGEVTRTPQFEGFRVARRKVLAPYTAAPGNAEQRLGDRNAESAL